MALTVADIERWNAGDVREVFHAATSRAQAAFDAADGLATLPALTSWGGESAEAAKEAIGQTRKDLDSHGNEAIAVANAARGAADNIEKIKSELASVKADAEALGMEIDPVSGTVVPGPKIRNPMEAELKQAQLQPRLNKIVAEANLVDMALANAINMAGGKTPIPPSLHANDPELQRALSQSLPEDPKQFRDLWDKLSQEDKDFLYSRDHSIGNHPGMPFVDRDRYNQQHLGELIKTTQNNIDQMQRRYDDLARQVYMGDKTNETGNELTRLGSQLLAARHSMDGYKAVQNSLHPSTDPNNNDPLGKVPRMLGFIDDQGHAAVSVGNPDIASRNAILVPGTGQDMAAFQGSNGKSEAMFRSTLLADPSLSANDVSVTTWMGYDRPMDLTEAAFQDRAVTGGAALDTYLNGMHASHNGPAAIDTVIGHSYGSTLVGGAASGGNHLAADNVIGVGSPGMLVKHAGDLHLDAGAQVYSMTASNDIITLATDTSLGPDPFGRDFGATRLFANPGPSWDPTGIIGDVAAHSAYWDSPTNPALQNMGAIIAGLPPVQIVTPDGVMPGS
ncbi:conserved hypothetical protein [uncultured Mycobacterium sp.]|uniref:DUF1023 domain-containing protein n=1 Tax=uncultured Mycobacterium sp. TaxID=171292 RepID=A0A1Y5PG36_9MYCO|nr:conserved hypothetical protein [uncultured Mycobacterium sp.]